MSEENSFSSNTIIKTTLAVLNEKLSAQREQTQYILSTVTRYHEALIKDLEQIRKDVNDQDNENFRYINDKIGELEIRQIERIESIYQEIKRLEYHIQSVMENSTEKNDIKFKTLNDYMIKYRNLPTNVDKIIKKVESLENWKWYVMGIVGAFTAWVSYKSIS